MAHWELERRAVIAQLGRLDNATRYDADRILLACQQAIGDTVSAEPWDAAETLYQVQMSGDERDRLDVIEAALCTASIEDRERHAALFGAFKMAQAFLWAFGHSDE